MPTFDAWFSHFCDSPQIEPHEWQRSIAAETSPRSRLIRIPTGMGKTLGVLAAWSWNRVGRGDAAWPRRLIWCLPTRVLVEQTEQVVRAALERTGVAWDGRGDHSGKVGVHTLMGGADPGGEWTLFPEECAVLVGTQDMLLSRALNRGYASGRARWPREFGLLGHDALWVMDEVQLMDVGLATSAQLQAYHDTDTAKGFRPRVSWWMSATLQPEWLQSVDTSERLKDWERAPVAIEPARLGECIGARGKSIATSDVPREDHSAFAGRVIEEHARLTDGDHGRITLVICNTVERACDAYDAIKASATSQSVELAHSRFRPAERATWLRSFLSRESCTRGVNRIIVATQVVEAGVDLSAGCVVTELAPWPNLVQRFGRCARYGGSGACLVVDRGRDDASAPPYKAAELEAAWNAVAQLTNTSGDVGVATLEEFERGLSQVEREALFPYEPAHLLLRREFDELFDTTPDLTGADIDISRFIRSGNERDLQVFWREVPQGTEPGRRTPPADWRAQRDELCSIPFLSARDWLCGKKTKTKRKMRAWIWDWIDGKWTPASRAALTPGRIVLVDAECGGYLPTQGFSPKWSEPKWLKSVTPVPPAELEAQAAAEWKADDAQGADDVSAARWKTIASHGREVADEARRICSSVELPPRVERVVVLSGTWHDLGKAHPAFQGVIDAADRPVRPDLAKAPKNAWRCRPGEYRTKDGSDRRPGLRHELASALALFAVLERCRPTHPALLGPWIEALQLTQRTRAGERTLSEPTACESEVLACSADEFDLLAYLVAAHHGKVRAALHAAPRDQDYRDSGDGRGLPIRGVREGDVLPSVVLDKAHPPLPNLKLTLEPALLGLSARTGRSWRERTLALQARFGPSALAWLEAILIAADRRASRLQTADPLLDAEQQSP